MCLEKFYNCVYYFYFIYGILVYFLWPISEICTGLIFRDKFDCEVSIGISNWLIIKGLASTFSSIIFYVLIYGWNILGLYYRCYRFLLCVMKILNLLIFIWLITGSVILWEYCYNITPKYILVFMEISLIFGYIILTCITFHLTCCINTTNDKNNPLLDVNSIN